MRKNCIRKCKSGIKAKADNEPLQPILILYNDY